LIHFPWAGQGYPLSNYAADSVRHSAKAYYHARGRSETRRGSRFSMSLGGRSRVHIGLTKSVPILSTLLVVILLLVSTASIHSVLASVTWFSPSQIDHYPASNNILPAALQASNGTIWLAWQSDRYAGNTGRNDVLYRTMTGTTWSSVHNFTSSGMNASPVLVQLSNGTILLFWSANPTGISCSPQCNIYYKSFILATQKWSSATQLSSGNFNDSLSSGAIARDGTLWLAWTRVVTNCSTSPCSTTKQLFYRTFKNNAWSGETQLTSDSNWNWSPSIIVGRDSIVRVAFSKTPVSVDNSQIYYKVYNGSWSPEVQKVSTSTSDEHTSLLQDRNGTLWLFWARKIYFTQLDFNYVLFNKFSFDNGNTWSTESQMTSTSTSVDSKMPWAIQANNSVSTGIWVFYSSNLLSNNFDIYALSSSAISPVHHLTITNISAAQGSGSSWTITVTVTNLGDSFETASVTLIMSGSTSYTLGPTSKPVFIGSSTNIAFTWDTSLVLQGSYSALATVAPVPGETLGNQGDNSLQTSNLITVTHPIIAIASGGGRTPFRA
jgi:hypothetical protein